jgi:hypothetical protein
VWCAWRRRRRRRPSHFVAEPIYIKNCILRQKRRIMETQILFHHAKI